MMWRLYYKNTCIVEDDDLQRILRSIEHYATDTNDILQDFNLISVL